MIRIKRKTATRIVRLLFATIFCILAFLGLRTLLETWKAKTVSQYPRQTLNFVIDLDRRENLFEQLERFAEVHDFDIRIRPTTPANKTFSIYLSRKDVIIWGDNVFNPVAYDFGFYDKNPSRPVDQSVIDSLLQDLTTFINKVPNVVVTEERKSLRITIDESQREELFAQMRKLANEHSVEFKLDLSSDETLFEAEIRGEGFHITSNPVVGSPKEISITFLIDYHVVPTSTSLETIDGLFEEFKRSIGEIPNVMISEEK